MKRTVLIAALLCAGSTLAFPGVAGAAPEAGFVLRTAPPPARHEGVPAPRRGHVWIPGFWGWDGHGYRWQDGRWEMERAGYRYIAPEWVRIRDGWQLRAGGWEPMAVSWHEVRVAPPPPRYEPVPYARPGFIWSPGHWEWYGQRYEWVAGSWLAERPGQAWTAPRWTYRGGNWNWEPGRWQQRQWHPDRDRDGVDDRAESGYRDRDRDGVPDRYEYGRAGPDHDRDHGRDHDHDRDHDGVPDRADRDRDGDGAPNGYDRAPDNPYRR